MRLKKHKSMNGNGMKYEETPFKISATAGRVSKKYHLNPVPVIKRYFNYWVEVVLK